LRSLGSTYEHGLPMTAAMVAFDVERAGTRRRGAEAGGGQQRGHWTACRETPAARCDPQGRSVRCRPGEFAWRDCSAQRRRTDARAWTGT